jgi:hypothetical protein
MPVSKHRKPSHKAWKRRRNLAKLNHIQVDQVEDVKFDKVNEMLANLNKKDNK